MEAEIETQREAKCKLLIEAAFSFLAWAYPLRHAYWIAPSSHLPVCPSVTVSLSWWHTHLFIDFQAILHPPLFNPFNIYFFLAVLCVI